MEIQSAEMPPKHLKVWLYYNLVVSDKNKCGRIILGETVNISNMLKQLIKHGENFSEDSCTVLAKASSTPVSSYLSTPLVSVLVLRVLVLDFLNNTQPKPFSLFPYSLPLNAPPIQSQPMHC